LQAALARRRDRLSRVSERLERHVTIGNEALALFVRFRLTRTPPLPEAMHAAAQAKGRERYEGFVEAPGRRLATGKALVDDIPRELDADVPATKDGATAPPAPAIHDLRTRTTVARPGALSTTPGDRHSMAKGPSAIAP
jgi:hypothetical protein